MSAILNPNSLISPCYLHVYPWTLVWALSFPTSYLDSIQNNGQLFSPWRIAKTQLKGCLLQEATFVPSNPMQIYHSLLNTSPCEFGDTNSVIGAMV